MRPHLIRTALNGLLVSVALVSSREIPILTAIEALCDACEDAAEQGNDGVVAVIYESSTVRVYKFDQCIPYILNNNDPIYGAYFCQPAKCSMSATTTCTGVNVPAVPFIAGETFVNAEDLGRVATNSARCERNATTNIPITLPVCPVATIFRNL